MNLPDDVVLTMRVRKNEKPIVDGSEIKKCLSCGKPVWVSPATRFSINKGLYPDNAFICLQCIWG